MKEKLFEVNRITVTRNGDSEVISKRNPRRPISLSLGKLRDLGFTFADRIDLDHSHGRTSISPGLRSSFD